MNAEARHNKTRAWARFLAAFDMAPQSPETLACWWLYVDAIEARMTADDQALAHARELAKSGTRIRIAGGRIR